MQALAGISMPPRTFTVYRVVRAGRDPKDPSGSCGYLGRWHNPAISPCFYTSLDESAALAEDESAALAEKVFHLPAGQHALTVATITASPPSVLDLTDHAVVGRLPFPLERCLASTPAASARGAVVGDAAFALGAAGLVVPCVRYLAPCVPIFTAQLGVTLEVLNESDMSVEVGEPDVPQSDILYTAMSERSRMSRDPVSPPPAATPDHDGIFVLLEEMTGTIREAARSVVTVPRAVSVTAISNS